MPKYIAVTNVYQPRDKGEPLLVRAGGQVELDQQDAQPLLERKAIRLPDDQQQPGPAEQTTQDAATEGTTAESVSDELRGARPTNNAPRTEWVAYADRLGVEGADGMRRDEIIAAVDRRLGERA